MRASIRSVGNCSSLEIFIASITDLQAITEIRHARYCFKYNLKWTISLFFLKKRKKKLFAIHNPVSLEVHLVMGVIRFQWNYLETRSLQENALTLKGLVVTKGHAGLFKVGLSSSPQKFFICFNDSPSKTMKNTFYFILKGLFVLKIFKFLSWLFGHVEKTAWLES